jgi:hypothetical protein
MVKSSPSNLPLHPAEVSERHLLSEPLQRGWLAGPDWRTKYWEGPPDAEEQRQKNMGKATWNGAFGGLDVYPEMDRNHGVILNPIVPYSPRPMPRWWCRPE